MEFRGNLPPMNARHFPSLLLAATIGTVLLLEQFAQNYMPSSDGTWNDFIYNSTFIRGYLIEWGGMPGDPSLVLTVDKTYDIAREGQFCAHQ